MKILMMMTGASYLTLTDGSRHRPSGVWGEEFAVPYQRFKERGYDLDVTTVGGIVPTFDASGLDPNGAKMGEAKGRRRLQVHGVVADHRNRSGMEDAPRRREDHARSSCDL
jgi:putative intracellular protease/amidase